MAMRRWLLGVGAALLSAAGTATAQNSRDVTFPGYLVIRVILDAGSSTAPGAGTSPLGGGDSGGDPDAGGLAGGFGIGGGPTGPMGGIGPMGGTGPMGGGRPGGPTVNEAKSIFVVAPFRQINFKPFFPDRRISKETNPVWAAMKTKYGTTYLYDDGSSIQLKPVPADVVNGTGFQTSLEFPVRDRFRRWSTNRKFEPIYEMTSDALALGMIDDAFNYANETVKLVDALKGEKDSKPSEKVAKFAEIWRSLSVKLDQPATGANDAEEWRARLSAAAVKTGKHYSIVYWGERQINPAELDRRLNSLERNFKAFYLWHALQGQTPAVPTKPFVCVLADRTTDMNPLRAKLDGLPIESDAFYSPSHDLLVLSPGRMDQLGASFSDLANASYKNGWSRDELLKGIPPTGGAKQSPQETARMMTLALVDKLLEEEMDHSAISREATRQLYLASGIIPRNVKLPTWLESGLASFLQHPKGPLFSQNDKGNSTMVAGLAFGYGAPNYVQHRHYKELDDKKQLNPAPQVLLKNVIMDRYFDAAKSGIDIDPPAPRPTTQAGGGNRGGGAGPGGGIGPMGPGGRGFGQGGPMGGFGPMGPGGGFGPMGPGGGIGPMGPGGGIGPMGPGGGGSPGETTYENLAINLRNSKEKLQAKADATSWALVYYLARSQQEGMKKFYAELNRMPRDMRLDEKVVLTTFCKSFNLMDRQKADQIDEEAFKHFAEMWVRSMRNVPVYGVEIAMAAVAGSGGQGGPMGPGGGAPPGRGTGGGAGGGGGRGGP